VVAYRLLAHFVRSVDRPVGVAAWEHPWVRTLADTDTGRARHVRLSAAAVLIQDNLDGRQARGLLLLPDVGTLPVASYRPVLRRLIELRQITDVAPLDEPLLVVGVAVGLAARVAAWQSLLRQVARRQANDRCTLESSPTRKPSPAGELHMGDTATRPSRCLASSPAIRFFNAGNSPHSWIPPRRAPASSSADWPLRAGSARSSVQMCHPTHSGLARYAAPALACRAHTAGRREAARRLLLPATAATRHHGLLGNEASTRRFWRHLAHTVWCE